VGGEGEVKGTGGQFVCYATDLNPDAVAATTSTAEAHGVSARVEVVRCDLMGPLKQRLRGTVDLLLFNPPYVLTPSEEVGRGGIAAAWAGGIDGREVLDRLLPDIGGMLAPGGTFLLLLLEQNKPKEVAAVLEAQGLTCKMMATCSADEERLHVMRALKPR
jgi:release factor glutamine methyltransferase